MEIARKSAVPCMSGGAQRLTGLRPSLLSCVATRPTSAGASGTSKPIETYPVKASAPEVLVGPDHALGEACRAAREEQQVVGPGPLDAGRRLVAGHQILVAVGAGEMRTSVVDLDDGAQAGHLGPALVHAAGAPWKTSTSVSALSTT